MRTLALLLATATTVLAGQPWKSAEFGFEIEFPDGWNVTDGSGMKTWSHPFFVEPAPRILVLAQAPTEEDQSLLVGVQIEASDEGFSSYGAIESTIEDRSRDISYVGGQPPRCRNFSIGSGTLGKIQCTRMSCEWYHGYFLKHIIYSIRTTNSKLLHVNCFVRVGDMAAHEGDFAPVLASVRCEKAVSSLSVVWVGVGLAIGAVVLLLIIVVVMKVRKSSEVPPFQQTP